MRRRVRVEEAALEAIVEQLAGSTIAPESFVVQDLVHEVASLEEHYDGLPDDGPGRRLTQHEPETVALSMSSPCLTMMASSSSTTLMYGSTNLRNLQNRRVIARQFGDAVIVLLIATPLLSVPFGVRGSRSAG